MSEPACIPTRLNIHGGVQVDLSTSSIRPGKSRAWLDTLKSNILVSVREAAAQGVKVMVHSGSWEHDVVQVYPALNCTEMPHGMYATCVRNSWSYMHETPWFES